MKKMTRQPFVLAVSLAAALALAGCGKTSDPGNTAPASPASSGHPDTPLASPPAPTPATQPAAGNATVTLGAVQLGSGVDASNKVVAVSNSFAPTDSIYAAVTTQGSGDVTVAARWTYQDGQVVHQDSKTLHASGPQTTSFMISHPDGFPTGDYKVDVSINGTPVASKAFAVK
jgi:hypothetical protein